MNGQLGDGAKRPPAGMTGPALLVVLLAIFGYLTYEAPLTSARPDTSSHLPEPPSPDKMHAVFARLWQDPFTRKYKELWNDEYETADDGIQKYFKTTLKLLKCETADDGIQKYFKTILKETAKKGRLLFMPVLLPGGPYNDDKELRMRIRYAVLAGLESRGYVLQFPRRITYVRIQVDLYIDAVNQLFEDRTYVVPVRLLTKDSVRTEAGGGRDKKIAKILICWLNQSQFGSRPLHVISQIFNGLFGDELSTCEKNNIQVSIIGPTGSDSLYAMAKEWDNCCKNKNKDACNYFAHFCNAKLYSPRATIGSDVLKTEKKMLDDFVCGKPFGLEVVRTIGTDKQLVDELRRELELRDAWPNRQRPTNNLVLITELDTRYGRALPPTFRKALLEELPKKVHVFQYLRGLDGKIPAEEEGDTNQSSDQSPEPGAESPEGRSQLDYLRRLQQELLLLQRKLKREGERISAVGVVGTDVYDKLLVLRALRRDFPRAWFFTTDLDTALTNQDEYRHTRNILVASHFGLQLHEKLQKRVPPFRDSYQTSVFFTTLLTVYEKDLESLVECDDPWRTAAGKHEDEHDHLEPLIFELGRSGAYQLTSPEEGKGEEFHPPHSREYVLWWFWVIGAIGIIAIAACVAFYLVRTRPFVVAPLAFIGWVVGLAMKKWKLHSAAKWSEPFYKQPGITIAVTLAVAGAGALLILIAVSHYCTDQEPFGLAEGISLWPAVLLRYAALLLALFFIWKSCVDLNKSYQTIGQMLQLPAAAKKPAGQTPQNGGASQQNNDRSALVETAVRLGQAAARFLTTSGQLVREAFLRWWNVEEDVKTAEKTDEPTALYTVYCQAANNRLRLIRSAVFAAVYFTFGLSLFLLSNFPSQPYRGGIVKWVDNVVLYSAIAAMIVLVFFIIDTCQLCRKFVRALAKREAAPPEDIGWDRRAIRAIAEHTKTVAELIYYPVAVTVLMALARHPAIDNFNFPWALVILLGFNLVLAVAVSWNLRKATEKVRDGVIRRLEERLAGVVGSDEARAEEYRLAIRHINDEETGAFRPLVQDPLFLAFAIPFGGVASIVVVQRLFAYMS